MPKITVFECDTCKRQIELELADDRPYPARCNITYKCPGLLQAKRQRNVRTELFPPIVYGLQDYIQRGSEIQFATDVDEDKNISLLSGINYLSIAALTVSGNFFVEDVFAADGVTIVPNQPIFNNPINIDDGSTYGYANSEIIKVVLELYELGVENTAFTEFYYAESGNTQQVSGIDDSPDRLLLRFSLDDQIRVNVNGNKLVRDVDFVATISSVGEQLISFTPILTDGLNIINVLVYKEPIDIANSNSPNIRELEFIGLAEGNVARQSCAWGDVLEAQVNGTNRLVMYCLDQSALQQDNRYQVRAAYVTSPVDQNKKYYLSLSKVYLLFGDYPYAFVDKSKDIVFNLNTAAVNSYQLEYIVDELNNITLFTPQSNLTNLTISVKTIRKGDTSLFDDADTQTNHENTNITSRYIIGYV